jgi:hypothetical protein
VTSGAATSSTTEGPRLDLLAYFPDDADAEFRARVDRIVVQLAARPPFLLDTFTEFVRHIVRRPKKFIELHGAQGLPARDRRRLEPRLWSRRQAYILVVGALLIWMDLPSLRCGKLMADDRVFGLGQKAIKAATGMSLTRIRNAIGDLVEAKYLTWTQPIARYTKQGPGGGVGFAAWNAIYRFELSFFERLHRDRKLAKQRKRTAERRAQRCRVYAASLVRARSQLRRAREHLHRPQLVPAAPARWRPPPGST